LGWECIGGHQEETYQKRKGAHKTLKKQRAKKQKKNIKQLIEQHVNLLRVTGENPVGS